MDGDEVGEVQGNVDNDGGDNSPGLNPAWNDVLSVLPEQFHNVVTPHFQQWDQSAQQRIEQVNSQLGQFEPYKPFVDNGISPEDLEQGIRLMYELNTNPQAVYEAIAEAHNFGGNGEQESEIEPEEGEEGAFQDPRFDNLQQGLDLVAQVLLEDQNKKIQAQAEADLESELTALREKHGDFDEAYVLSLMANDISAEDAIAAFQGLSQNILQKNPRPFAPSVMGNSGGGTGLPSQAIDPRKLSGKDTRSLVEQMLRASAAED